MGTEGNQMSSYQQLFDKAIAALLEQGRRSVGGDGYCAYRGNFNMKCAIGHLLTDEQIDKYRVKEGDSPINFNQFLIEELCPGTSNFSEAKRFLHNLQKVHDACFDSIHYREDLLQGANDLARRWQLKEYSKPNEDFQS